MKAVADASFLIALIDRNHPENYRCMKVFHEYHTIYASRHTIAGVLKHLRQKFGETAELEFIRKLSDYKLMPVRLDWQDIARAKHLASRYNAVDLSAAVNAALAEKLVTETILTLEHDRYEGTRLYIPPRVRRTINGQVVNVETPARQYRLLSFPRLEPPRIETIAIYVFVDSEDDARSQFVEQIASEDNLSLQRRVSQSRSYGHRFDDQFFLYFICECQIVTLEPYFENVVEIINEIIPGLVWLIDHLPDEEAVKQLVLLSSLVKKPIVVAINDKITVNENELQIPESLPVVRYSPDDKESIKNVLLVLCDEVLKDIAHSEAEQ